MFTTYIYFIHTEQIMLLLLRNTLNGLLGHSFLFFNQDEEANFAIFPPLIRMFH